MNIVVTILITVLVFGVIIFIHELGHFATAKSTGIRVNEFALGMGPTIFKIIRGETKYSLRAFPIGGFVSMEGEDEESSDEHAFNRRPLWCRILVVVAGAFMNLVLGFIVVLIITLNQNAIASTTIAAFDSAATSSSMLKIGDEILKINGSMVKVDYDIIFSLVRDTDGKADFVIKRDGKIVELKGIPFPVEKNAEFGQSIRLDFKVYPVKKTFFSVLHQSFFYSLTIGRIVWVSLLDLVTGRFGVQQLSGPVGVSKAIGQASAIGWQSLLSLVAFITINVGIFNLLPLPALDGGRLLFLLIELVRRKPINPKYEGIIHTAGFALLILLMVFVTFNDIVRLIKG
jgi:regulator of sigma E protease